MQIVSSLIGRRQHNVVWTQSLYAKSEIYLKRSEHRVDLTNRELTASPDRSNGRIGNLDSHGRIPANFCDHRFERVARKCE